MASSGQWGGTNWGGASWGGDPPANITVDAPLGTAGASGFSPSISSGSTLSPGVGVATAAGLDPAETVLVGAPLGTAGASGLAPVESAPVPAPLGTSSAAGFGPALTSRIGAPLGTSSAAGFGPAVAHGHGIIVSVYDADDPTVLLGTLDDSLARQWRDAFNDPGTFSFKIPARDAGASLIGADRVVRFSLNGTIRFAGVIGPYDRDSVAAGEEAAELTQVNGSGVLDLLSRAVIYPELGINRLSPPQRYFDFASTSFDDSSWTSAVDIKLQSDHTLAQWRTTDDHSAPASWPDPTAYWIWSRAQTGGTPPQPVGSSYFRKTFTLAGQTPVSIFITADDGFELYIDAALVASETRAFMWNQTRRVDLVLDAGTHLIAIKGTNIQRDSAATNIAGILCSVITATEGGDSLGAVIVNTDNSWKASDYPAVAPTMTPGEILKVLIDEAHARGTISGVSYDFTKTADSNGNAWSVPIDVSYPVGTTYLDVVRHLVALAIDVRMDPITLVLHAYNTGTMGTTKPVTLAIGTHFTVLKHQVDPPIGRDAIVQYHTGIWAERSSVTTPRKEFAVSLGGAPSDDQVNRAVDLIFADHAQQKVYLSWQCVPVAGGTAYEDWLPGDLITAPDPTDNPAATRVTAIVVTEAQPAQDGTIGGTTIYTGEGEQ